MQMSRCLAALFGTFLAAGCVGLPYFLAENRDTIVGIEVALESVAAPAGPAAASTARLALVRRFVRGNDLHELSAAVANVMATTTLDEVVNDQTLRRLEERMVDATRPFAVNPETAKSFIVTPDKSRMSDATIYAVDRFVPDAAGVNFRQEVTFRPAGAAVYQLGHGGTAERRLWTWTGESGAREP